MALVGHWKLQDNAASTTVVATVGTNGTASANTSTFSITGYATSYPRALDFNGTSHQIDLTTGNAGCVNSASAISLMAWIYQDTPAGTDRILLISTAASAGSSRAAIYIDNSGLLIAAARAGDGESLQTKTTSSALSAGLHHVCAVIDYPADTIDIYIDGSLVSSTGTIAFTGSAAGSGNALAVTIGAISASNFFDGRIYDVRVYNSNESANLASIIAEANADAPVSLVAPSISGTPEVDKAVTVTPGTWIGATTLAYQWYHNTTASTSGGTPIAGATELTPRIDDSLVGKYLYASEAGTNSGGTTTVYTNVLGPVVSATGELNPDDGSELPFAWWDASDPDCFTGGVHPSAGATTTWLDKSGNGKDLVQSGTDALPLYQSSPHRIEFNATATVTPLNCAGFFSGGGWGSTRQLIFVLRVRNTAGTANDGLLWDGTTGHWWRGFRRNVGGDGKTYATGARTPAGQEYLAISIVNNSSDATTGVPPSQPVFLDGSLIGWQNDGPGNPTADAQLTLGFVNNWKGDICEALYYDEPNSFRETASILRGLRTKWSIPTPDTGHALVLLGNSTSAFSSPDGCWLSYTRELLDADGYWPELWNLGEPSGTAGTLSRQRTERDAVVADCVARGKKVVVVLFHGHNNTWGTSFQNTLETYLASLRSGYPDSVRTISISQTPNFGTTSQSDWTAIQDWHDNSGLTYHDGIVTTRDFEFANAYNKPDGANDTGSWYDDSVHFSKAGMEALAAAVYPEVLAQIQSLDEAPPSGGNIRANYYKQLMAGI